MRCAAKNRDGTRCRSYAMKGQKRCRMHGAASPQARKRGDQRRALEEAKRMVARAGVEMDPIEHLLDSLHHAAQLAEVFGMMAAALDEASAELELRGELRYHVAALDSPNELAVASGDHLLGFNHDGEAQLHPFLVEHRRWVEIRAKFAKLCLDARIDERLIALHERQVKLAQQAFEAMLEELGFNAPKRQEARQAYARHLRAAA